MIQQFHFLSICTETNHHQGNACTSINAALFTTANTETAEGATGR